MICHVVYRGDHTGNGVITEHRPQRAGIVGNVCHISGNGRIPQVNFYFRAGIGKRSAVRGSSVGVIMHIEGIYSFFHNIDGGGFGSVAGGVVQIQIRHQLIVAVVGLIEIVGMRMGSVRQIDIQVGIQVSGIHSPRQYDPYGFHVQLPVVGYVTVLVIDKLVGKYFNDDASVVISKVFIGKRPVIANGDGVVSGFQVGGHIPSVFARSQSRYNRTGCNIEPATVAHLVKNVENIVGVKEASGNISQVAKIMSLTDGNIDLYSGNDDQIVPLLSLGGKGVISVLSNVAPKETHDICEKFFAGDVAGSAALQLKAVPLIDQLFCEVNPIPVKKAMKLMGMDCGPLRMPMTELTPEHEKTLAQAMKDFGITLA